ncbi:BspA family leucine-rich repeat surface protein [uncultured Brachyspira sp.]|uniref:BspA family leucine-rich repeat surface protein n=1 Tax=uncultured Brachyspira sp. TaxID=221953 RepID=UPI003414DBB6
MDTSLITDMSEIFYFYDIGGKDFSGIEKWNTSNVTNMSGMFNGCQNFNQPLNNETVDYLSLKWILYLYAYSNINVTKVLEKNIKEIYKIALESKDKKIIYTKNKLENLYYDDLKELLDYKLFETIE